MGRERIPLGTWSTVKAAAYTEDGKKTSGAKKWRKLVAGETAKDFPAARIRYRASAYYRGKNGRRERAEAWGKSEAGAKRALQKKLPERVDTALSVQESRTTVADMAEKWWAAYDEKDPATRQTKGTYRDALDRHVLPNLGGYSISEVTTGLLTTKLGEIGATAPSNAWFARVLLKHIFTFAVRRDAIERNPVEGTPTFKTKSSAPVAATVDQLKLVRKVIKAWQHAQTYGPPRGEKLLDVLDLMLVCGCRTGEALAVRGDDLVTETIITEDGVVEADLLTLSGTIVQLRGGTPPHRQDHPKTEAGYRRPHLPPEMAGRLRARIAKNPPTEDGLIFPTRDGQPMSPNNFRSALRRALKGSGLEGALKPYLMRKTAATEVAREMSMEAARDLLGHTSVEVTKKHYAEHDISVVDTSVVLGDLLRRAQS